MLPRFIFDSDDLEMYFTSTEFLPFAFPPFPLERDVNPVEINSRAAFEDLVAFATAAEEIEQAFMIVLWRFLTRSVSRLAIYDIISIAERYRESTV